MQYLDELRQFIDVLIKSKKFNLLCVEGPPGWGKSHSTREALINLNVDYKILGSYSTALALYNFMAEHSNEVLVLDDTAGIFHNPQALSILNAASWPGGAKCGLRLVKWTSTSELVSIPQFKFTGKIIVLTNFVPDTPQARAFVSRSLNCSIIIHPEMVGKTLLDASISIVPAKDQKIASEVAAYLGNEARKYAGSANHSNISLRTLELGIELATTIPESWKRLLANNLQKLTPNQRQPATQGNNVKSVVAGLTNSGLKVKEQIEKFQALTGKSRRAFFYTRKSILVDSTTTELN